MAPIKNLLYQGIYPVSLRRFAKQLDELGKYLQFVSGSDVLAAVDGRKKLPERSCLITFDDGLRCQYEQALPILDKKGIPAMFLSPVIPILTMRF